jgi:hypothetical protein
MVANGNAEFPVQPGKVTSGVATFNILTPVGSGTQLIQNVLADGSLLVLLEFRKYN